MSSGPPIVRQMSWLGILPQLAALFSAMSVGYVVGQRNGMLVGIVAYLAYSVGSRELIAKDHRAGIRLFRQQQFEAAIQKFADSLAFFDRHPWIDQFRSITLMSASAVSYREMALANIAFCYGQLGDGEQSRAYYRRCLERFPESGLAIAALRMLDAAAVPAG